MSATNKTTYYELPIFIGTDVPSWLGDWNDAMTAIDAAINGVKTAADGANTTATSADNKVDAQGTTITAMQAEINTLKQAVQNYDNILSFTNANIALVSNNLDMDLSGGFLVQNTNKTLSKGYIRANIATSLDNPIFYNYTDHDQTVHNFVDLMTVEDNCFKLTQSSQPNATTCLTLGVVDFTYYRNNTDWTTIPKYLRAWFDGATTHIGATLTKTESGASVATFLNSKLTANFTVFLSGNVYNPDDGGSSPT